MVALISFGILPQGLQRPDSAHLLWVTCVSFPFLVPGLAELLRGRVGLLNRQRIALVAGAATLLPRVRRADPLTVGLVRVGAACALLGLGVVLVVGAWRHLAAVLSDRSRGSDPGVLTALTRVPRVVWNATFVAACALSTWVVATELVATLRRNYCGHVGLEYMHINDLDERRFLQDRMEGRDKDIHFTPEGKQAILAKVIEGEQWERFLARKYVGTKRFGLDGGESMIPALEAVIKYGGAYGVTEITFGMCLRVSF